MTPGIHETAVLSPAELGAPDASDRVTSAATHGFVIDLVALEVDPATGAIRIDKYVSVHDVGRQLNPRIVEGQIRGGFVHGLGGALMEEFAYDNAGHFLSGTFADYLCPTAMEVPPLIVGHVETATPANPLGAKGMGDGSSMLTPAAVANAVADALGRDDVELPLTLRRVWALANGLESRRAAPAIVPGATPMQPGNLTGSGEVVLDAPVAEVWRRLIDPDELAAVIPGCRGLTLDRPDHYLAEVLIGVAGIRGVYLAEIELTDKREHQSLRLAGRATGALGFGSGQGFVSLVPDDGRTRLSYRYDASIGGKVAGVGQRMLGTVTRLLIAEFFRALQRRLAPQQSDGWRRWWSRIGGRSAP
jgi:2-furoyl-CoA dehydrogenase large subunit